VRAVGDLIRQGKLRYYGVSNFRGWRIAELARLADQLGIERPVVSEPLYNIVDRTAEVEQLPAAAHYGLGVVPYSPLARGVLTSVFPATPLSVCYFAANHNSINAEAVRVVDAGNQRVVAHISLGANPTAVTLSDGYGTCH
jgi:aryl-alcohol dehydrogenase-like predicted oxidoreductase